jgi:hypothetical protein
MAATACAHLATLTDPVVVSSFYFKRSSNENCKIRKEVKFPLMFDAYTLCTPELKAKLTPARQR